MPFWNHCAICGKRIEVGEPCIGIEKKNTELVGDSICFDCVNIENMHGLDKTVAITDLLARAEAAEARCETLEKMVKEYQDTIAPGYRERAEKAEREAKESQREVTLCRNGWKKAERERDAAVKTLDRLDVKIGILDELVKAKFGPI